MRRRQDRAYAETSSQKRKTDKQENHVHHPDKRRRSNSRHKLSHKHRNARKPAGRKIVGILEKADADRHKKGAERQ